jgi:alkanesulfonate monooxygenase SsuD/methylene tetrahydromethanopterin reductase-like flavin-dependent oxidoreductase (luciferase family)
VQILAEATARPVITPLLTTDTQTLQQVWLGGTVPASAERAGRLGDAWLTGQNAAAEDLLEQLELYRKAAARAGRPQRPVLRRDIYVGESDEEARAVVGAILAEGYRGTGLDQLLVGSADTVVLDLRRYGTWASTT